MRLLVPAGSLSRTVSKRVRRKYTQIGARMAALASGQRELAKVLRVTQQTVSKKLRGDTEILLSDIERLSQAYGVPMAYFFDESALDPQLAAAMERAGRGSPEMGELFRLVSRFPEGAVREVLEAARVLARGMEKEQEVASPPSGLRAAEGREPYGPERSSPPVPPSG